MTLNRPAGYLRRVGRGVGVAVVGERLDAQAGHGAVVLEAELGVDVVVAGERVGLEVLGPVLDPLHGPPERQRGDDRDDVARVDRHLAAEPAADVVGLDPDRRLGDPGDQADDRPVRVGRLARDVEVEVAVDGVVVGDAATGLDRGHVDARDVDVDRHDPVGRLQGGVRRRPVTRLPVPDVVVRLVRAAVRPQDGRVGLERLERVDDHLQRLVVDVDGGDRVGRLVAGQRDDRGDLLRLVHDRVDRQHHLLVAGQRRHPVEARRPRGPCR